MNQHSHIQPLNDQERMTDILTQEKMLIKDYGSMICEASCSNLRGLLENNMAATAKDQYDVFDQMRTRGWYQTKPALEPDVLAAKQKFAQMKSTM